MMRKVSLVIQSLLYITAGIMHFVKPDIYLKIMPPQIPADWHAFLVMLSGIFEILFGAGLLWVKTRKWAALGLILLLIAIFPANIYMAAEHEMLEVSPCFAYGRLPLQFLLVWWAWLFFRKPALK